MQGISESECGQREHFGERGGNSSRVGLGTASIVIASSALILEAVGPNLISAIRSFALPAPSIRLSGNSFTERVRVQGKVLSKWGVIVDPDNHCQFDVKANTVSVNVPSTIHGLSIELKRMNAPRILKEIEGDFVAEVSVEGEFSLGDATRRGFSYNGAWHFLKPKQIELNDSVYIGVVAINSSKREFRPRFTGLQITEKRSGAND